MSIQYMVLGFEPTIFNWQTEMNCSSLYTYLPQIKRLAFYKILLQSQQLHWTPHHGQNNLSVGKKLLLKYWKGFLMRRPKTIKIFLRSFYNSSKKELFKLCSMQLYVSLSPDYTLISFDDRYLLHKDLVWHYYMAI